MNRRWFFGRLAGAMAVLLAKPVNTEPVEHRYEWKSLPPIATRVFKRSDVHLVTNPFLPAYARYYVIVGVVIASSLTEVTVQVYGLAPEKFTHWALARKAA